MRTKSILVLIILLPSIPNLDAYPYLLPRYVTYLSVAASTHALQCFPKFSLTSTYLYRAFPLSISIIAWLASFNGRSWIQDLIFLSAASCNISRISQGAPVALPPTLMPLAINVNALIGGRLPPSGALSIYVSLKL